MENTILLWIIVILLIFLMASFITIIKLYNNLSQERFNKKSLSSKYGKLTEQFLPLVESFPWDPGKFRFLGSPIDGVQFANDKIIFVEFKTANSQLSSLQRHIRDLVNNNKVTFEIIRVK